jgi:calmodulin
MVTTMMTTTMMTTTLTKTRKKTDIGLPFPEYLVWARRLREAEIEEYRKQFRMADVDHGGTIGPEEMRSIITRIGYMPLREIIDEVLAKVDSDGNNDLDFEEFVNMMVVFRKSDGFTDRQMAEFRAVFNTYKEVAENGDEVVNCLELMEVLRSMGYVTNLDMVRKFIKQVDFDNSNSLDLQEFVRLMRMNREVEMQQALEAFTDQADLDVTEKGHHELRLKPKRVLRVLRTLGYRPSEEAFADAVQAAGLEMVQLSRDGEDAEASSRPPSQEASSRLQLPENDMDFDTFVKVLDGVRKALMVVRRMNAGYSDEDVEKYLKDFNRYDEDHNGDIEKHELTNLLDDLGIPMRSKSEQQAMLEKLDEARIHAREAGVGAELINKMGSPSVKFGELLFLVRMLDTAKDYAEVDRDRDIMEKTGFTPKEAEDFREIFIFWAAKAAALDSGNEAVELPPDVDKSLAMLNSGMDSQAAASSSTNLSKDGLRRVVRSLGLHPSDEEKELLDTKINDGQDPKSGKYGFFEFLMFMRWMMDSNFAHIKEATEAAASGAEFES